MTHSPSQTISSVCYLSSFSFPFLSTIHAANTGPAHLLNRSTIADSIGDFHISQEYNVATGELPTMVRVSMLASSTLPYHVSTIFRARSICQLLTETSKANTSSIGI